MSFIPNTPLPAPAIAPLEAPPRVMQTLYVSEKPQLAARLQTEVERRLERAEERFEAGKRAFQDGDKKLARTEFDRALDVLLSAPQDIADRRRLEHRLDELVDSIYRYDLEQLGAGETKQAVVYEKSPLESMLEMTFPIDPKLKPKVKEEIQATLSQLPLEGNDTVLGYINYFSTERGRKVLLSGLRRAGRYRPLIQRILDEEGVPQELLCLAQAESGFMPRAISYKSATGMWQFMREPATNTACRRTPIVTTGSIRRSPRAPRPGCCATCTPPLETGISPWPLTIADRIAWTGLCSAPASRTSGNCRRAMCCLSRP